MPFFQNVHSLKIYISRLNLPFGLQASGYRKMLLAQTRDEVVLSGVSSTKGISQLIMSKKTDQERVGTAACVTSMANTISTANVSYIGNNDFPGADKYISDFRIWTSASENLLIEISDINERFGFDIIQPFSSPVFVNAFLEELKSNGLSYKLQDVMKLEVSNISLPWNE